MVYLVNNDDVSVLESAIKEHGASEVFWYASFSRRREGVAVGMTNDIIAKQMVELKDIKKDFTMYSSKKSTPAPKKKETKGAIKGVGDKKTD